MPDPHETPRQRYDRAVATQAITADATQSAVVDLLDDLHQRLMRQPKPGGFTKLLSRLTGQTDEPVKGLYLWGGVGRGKTMLMDMFCECLPHGMVQRLHFHRFMQRVHQELRGLEGTANPLLSIADKMSQEARVLCFDEFFVSDIGDAMILGELLTALFQRGVTLVATSNVEPKHLYENGLQRRRFLPAIEQLQIHTAVHHVDGAVDFRLRVLERAELYHWPLDDTALESLSRSFAALITEPPKHDVDIVVEGRDIRVHALADDVAWFEFSELCEGPRSQNDYIELAREFHTVLVNNVPRFDTASEDAARRFISLVDEFYDRAVKLILAAAVPIPELYQGEKLRFEFERTESRLLEMQSTEYLGRSHKA